MFGHTFVGLRPRARGESAHAPREGAHRTVRARRVRDVGDGMGKVGAGAGGRGLGERGGGAYSRVLNKRTKVIRVPRSQNTPKSINVPDPITVPESKIHKTNKRSRIQ